MIFIVVKLDVRPEYADRWPELVAAYTAAPRAEPGNLWFEWSRSLDEPNTYVLIEAFEDGDAPAEHVNSDHFAAMRRDFPQYLASTPRIISRQIDGSGWDRMSELQVD